MRATQMAVQTIATTLPGSSELRGDLCVQDLAEGLVAEGGDYVDEELLDTLADALDLLLSDLLGGVLPRGQVHAEQR